MEFNKQGAFRRGRSNPLKDYDRAHTYFKSALAKIHKGGKLLNDKRIASRAADRGFQALTQIQLALEDLASAREEARLKR